MTPVFKPYMRTQEILRALRPVLDSGWIGLGPKTEEFEAAFATYHGKKYAIAVNSCTAALHLALAVSGVAKGDEVLVPSLTFASTALAALYQQATPVFVDVDPMTLCMQFEDAASKVTSRTKALITTNFGGGAGELKKFKRLAKRLGIAFIEDNAHGCGGSYQGKLLGTFGDIGCFSFHAVKNLPISDGGMLVTDDPEIAQKLFRLRWLGINKSTWQRGENKYSWRYSIDELGYKYHMNDILATIGLVQLTHLAEDNQRRAELAFAYNQALDLHPLILIPQHLPGVVPAWHNYTIQLMEPVDRNKLAAVLSKEGISTTVHYEPLHLHKVFAGKSRAESLHGTMVVWPTLLTLPLYPQLSNQEQKRIIKVIKTYVDKVTCEN